MGVSQGYDLKDQPACIKMATAWITQVTETSLKMSENAGWQQVQKSVLTQKGTESLSLLQGDSTLQQD